MIGLDTNVLVRYIAQDDAKQSKRATDLLDTLSVQEPGYVSTVALVELIWVMQSCYQATKVEIVAIIDMLLHTEEIVVEHAEVAIMALRRFEASSADFSDCLIESAGREAGCFQTVTFDRKASKTAGMQLLS